MAIVVIQLDFGAKIRLFPEHTRFDHRGNEFHGLMETGWPKAGLCTSSDPEEPDGDPRKLRQRIHPARQLMINRLTHESKSVSGESYMPGTLPRISTPTAAVHRLLTIFYAGLEAGPSV